MRITAWLLAALLLAPNAAAAICEEGYEGMVTNLAGNQAVVSFEDGGTVPTGNYGNAGTSVWNHTLGFPGDTTVDALSITGDNEVCWLAGIIQGPMQAAQDADTYYECDAEHGYTGGTCLPYHTTAAVAAVNHLTHVEKMRLSGWGDGFSAADHSEFSLGGVMDCRGCMFEFVHDDVMEDDFCASHIWLRDSYVKSAFNVFATRSRNASCDSTIGRNLIVQESYIRTVRFTNAYKGPTRPGHGGFFKTDSGVNPQGYFIDSVYLFGPVSGDQQQFYDPAETVVCTGNVYLWDGTNAKYEEMLDAESNRSFLAGLRSAFGGDACITVVKREDVCPSCTIDADGGSEQFRGMNLAALGNSSWNALTSAWYYAHFPSGQSCGVGPELVLLLPVLRKLRRRAII
jgi:hypothetical protein